MQRSTRQRLAIQQAIDGAGRPLSPHEVLQAARSRVPKLGIATVYRHLKLLADARAVQPVQLPGAAVRYEAAGHGHHHHFQCTQCDRVFDVDGCSGDLQQHAPPGFVVQRHEVILYGRCPACKPQRRRAGGAAGAVTARPTSKRRSR